VTVESARNKHQQNSAKTRERLIDAAVELYGNRSIDAVSLREISVAAGQRNPNALQYHFGNREGLLQAIIDRHAAGIGALRERYFVRARAGEWPAAEAAAHCLVMPIVEYVDSDDHGIHFVRIVSQIAAVHQDGLDLSGAGGIRFPRPAALAKLFQLALHHVPREEAQRRTYLVVNTTFHAIADIYRAAERLPAGNPVADKSAMVEQLLGLVQSFITMPLR
jgi:AcrR family transcriptional regulator